MALVIISSIPRRPVQLAPQQLKPHASSFIIMAAPLSKSVPPSLKKIVVFLRRAEELDHDKSPESRVVAYNCRQVSASFCNYVRVHFSLMMNRYSLHYYLIIGTIVRRINRYSSCWIRYVSQSLPRQTTR